MHTQEYRHTINTHTKREHADTQVCAHQNQEQIGARGLSTHTHTLEFRVCRIEATERTKAPLPASLPAGTPFKLLTLREYYTALP